MCYLVISVAQSSKKIKRFLGENAHLIIVEIGNILKKRFLRKRKSCTAK